MRPLIDAKRALVVPGRLKETKSNRHKRVSAHFAIYGAVAGRRVVPAFRHIVKVS